MFSPTSPIKITYPPDTPLVQHKMKPFPLPYVEHDRSHINKTKIVISPLKITPLNKTSRKAVKILVTLELERDSEEAHPHEYRNT